MIIQNVRLGHACNSSSSHSVIFQAMPEIIAPERRLSMRDFNYSLNSYGWEWFKLSTPEQKADYMMAYYYSSLPRTLTPRSEEHTSELQSHHDLVYRLLLEKKKKKRTTKKSKQHKRKLHKI